MFFYSSNFSVIIVSLSITCSSLALRHLEVIFLDDSNSITPNTTITNAMISTGSFPCVASKPNIKIKGPQACRYRPW